ncbi:MAG: SOUL family heme-binding protein [Rubripirellula sp.]
MSRSRMLTFGVVAVLCVVGYFGWKLTFRNAYESAEYQVVVSENAFQIRDYPELMLASTSMEFERQGNDGSFMRLFRFISGNNDAEQKVAMTVPVFMEREADAADGSMGFVMPKLVADEGVPRPADGRVQVKRRPAGRFAVIRFAGKVNDRELKRKEQALRTWIEERGLQSTGATEVAGYDPPWTPGLLRRNEVLIRIK